MLVLAGRAGSLARGAAAREPASTLQQELAPPSCAAGTDSC